MILTKHLIGDLCSFSKGASIPRDRTHEKEGFLYLHYGDLYAGHNLYVDVENPEKMLPRVDCSEKIRPDQFVDDGDIIYVLTSETVDDLGHAFCINNPNHKRIVAGTETTVMRVNRRDVVDPRYLNYILQTPLFLRKLRQYVTGMKVFRVHPRDISRIEVNLPPLDQQLKVIGLLDAVYFKLRLNSRINDHLLEYAEVLFALSFGELKTNGFLSDVVDITMGQSPPGASYNEDGIGVVFYQGRGEFGWRFPNRRLFTTEPKRMASKNDVLLSVRAPVGDINVAFESCCIGRGLAAIHSCYPSYCYYLMRSLRKNLDAFNGDGTVFGSISGRELKALPVVIPANYQIEEFEGHASRIDRAIRNNEMQNRLLAMTRDALLPKLMSGEIDVSQVDLTQLNGHLAENSIRS